MKKQVNSCLNQTEKLKLVSMLANKAITAIKNGTIKKRNLVWLELTGCSGNIISLLDAANPGFKNLATQMVNIIFDNSLMVAEGQEAMEKLFAITADDYILVVEGAIASKDNGLYNIIGQLNGQPITAYRAINELGPKASYVIAMGACASDGGVSAGRPNPSGSLSVQSVLNRKVIKLPGCPCHPDWLTGTLSYILLYGQPELDAKDRPTMFYSTLIHDVCPRRPYFNQGIFAEKLGDKTCMFKIGCRGPVTPVDCPVRKWNQHVNWPIGDDSPCIGCAQFGFPDRMEPFISYNTTREV